MPAIAAVPELAVGLAVLLFLYATEPIWYPAAVQIIEGLPGLFQPPLTAFVNQMRSWINAFHGWLDQHLQPLALTVWQFWFALSDPVAAIVPMLESVFNALYRVNYHAVPGAQATAISVAEQLYNQATFDRWASEAVLSATESADHLGAIAYSQQLYNQAVWYAAGQFGAAWAHTDAQFTQAIAYSQQLYNQALAQSGAALAQAVAQLDLDLAQVEGQAVSLFAAVETDARGWVETLRADTASELADLGTQLRDQIGTVAATLGGSLALTQEAVQAIEGSDCMRFCNVLGGLGALLQGAELAGLLALLAKAYEDPQGAVDLVNQDLVQPAEQALGDVLGLFGIKAA